MHPCLKSDKHKTLMDVYYSEAHMRNWSEECIKGEEKLFEKADKLEQNLNTFNQQLITANFPPLTKPITPLTESKELIAHLENFLNEKEPLIISMLSQLVDDLRNLHLTLKTESIDKISADKIKGYQEKIKAHKELTNLMKEHNKELDGLLKAFVKTKLSNAKSIGLLIKDLEPYINQIKTVINGDIKKSMAEAVSKSKSDFGFLLNPGLFPGAYLESLREVIRRTNVNEILQKEAKKLQQIAEKEQNNRKNFVDSYANILPADFFAYLKNIQVPIEIKINPVKDMQEINDPDLEKSIDLTKLKLEISSHVSMEHEKEFEKLKQENEKLRNDFKLQKEALKTELEELQKDFDQQKQENITVQSSLHSKISELNFSLEMKTQDEAQLLKTLKNKEDRILNMEKECEKLNKLILDAADNYKEQISKKQSELDKKDKEVYNLLVDLEKNTLRKKNCAFCGELIEFKGNKDDYLNEINQKIIDKNNEIKILETKLEQCTKMMSISGASLFNLMSNKVNDKEVKIRLLKEDYEARLMESQEYLASEHDKCAIFTKQQIVSLNEKISELNKQITESLDLLKKKDDEINILKGQILKNGNKHVYYEKENKRLLAENNKFSALNKSLQIDNDKLQKDALIRKEITAQKESIIKQLTEQKLAFQKDCSDAKLLAESRLNEIEKLTISKKELESKITTLEAKFLEKSKELAAAEMKLLAKQQEFEQKINNLELKNKENDQKYGIFEQKNKEKQNEIEKQTKEHEKLLKEHEKLRIDNEILIKEHEKLRKDNEKIIKDLEKLTKDSEKSAKEHEKLVKDLEKLVKENSNDLQEIDKLRNAILLKEKEIQNNIEENSKLAKNLQNSNTDLKDSKEIIEKLKIEINQLQILTTPKGSSDEEINLHKKLAEKEAEIVKIQQELQKYTTLVDSLQKQEEQYKHNIETLKTAAETEKQQTGQEINALRVSLQKAKDVASEKEKILEINAKTLLETRTKLESCEKIKESLEESMRTANATISKKYASEGIHYGLLEKGNKMLFMPHSPGIYVALLLSELNGEEDKKQATSKKSGANVVKKKMSSYVFLDLGSLPEKLRTILTTFSMLVIGIIKEVNSYNASEENPYNLEKGQKYYQCSLQRLENIVGFEADEPLLTNYEFQQDN